MWYVYTMEYYSVIRKNEIMPLAARWTDLEVIMLSKQVRDSQTSYDVIFMHNLKKWYK